MKAKNKLRKDVLSTVIANAKSMAIEKGADRENVSEEIVNIVLLKEKKLLHGMIDEFPDSATSKEHLKLKESYHKKLEIVLEYAPQVVDDPDEIRAMIANSGIELDKKNIGKIMGLLKNQKCDMGIANQVVKSMLN